jgi:uncharacterized protein YydD (DUF2326 family)
MKNQNKIFTYLGIRKHLLNKSQNLELLKKQINKYNKKNTCQSQAILEKKQALQKWQRIYT